jgi:hypothetical protein
MPRTTLRDVDVASWCRLYLAAKSFHVGVNVDGIVCPLHCPMACCCQMRGQGFLSGTNLARRVAVGGGAFLGWVGVNPPGLDI